MNRGDDLGEMGDSLPVIDLGAGRTATAISAGANHTCALLDNGTIKCWGNNAEGALGLGHINDIGDDANETGDTDDRGDNIGEMGDNLPSVEL